MNQEEIRKYFLHLAQFGDIEILENLIERSDLLQDGFDSFRGIAPVFVKVITVDKVVSDTVEILKANYGSEP